MHGWVLRTAKGECVNIKSVFHLLELASQTGQSVNRMRDFEGMVLQEEQSIRKMVPAILKKFEVLA